MREEGQSLPRNTDLPAEWFEPPDTILGFTACPWCPASGPPNFMNGHMKCHEDEVTFIDNLRAKDGAILVEVGRERVRQDEEWGEQNHPDGTDTRWAVVADGMKAKCQIKADKGTLTFRDIFEEEIWEAYGEEDPERLRVELVQAAAVLVAWIGAIDRRRTKGNENDEG